MPLLTIDLYLPGALLEGMHNFAAALVTNFSVLVFAQLNCLLAYSFE